ncbi:MAG: excinuclease ABC subunit UvrC [Candidatus Omnitrophica bacterium]|nr:excinuclease ABC subunit UvrC [Candidatus Omnitrophota bacterium]MDD5436151.1 excinuclease ABC subunit UvrC [Candidatus Omnitrophota bacterium]
MDLKEKVRALPGSPGVYIMKGTDGRVLYVGKAGNLRKRVSSYFYPRRILNERISRLVSLIEDIEYMPTATEAEALIYENSLIKQLTPKYNIALRDDKSYPMLKLTINEKFPRLFITRTKAKDGALYYGPYAAAKLLKEAVIILRQIFPLRTCGKLPKRACLNYHIRQCLAPCIAGVSDSDYGEIVTELRLFLEGKKAELLKVLAEKMAVASRKEDFERAAQLRGRIEALSSIKEDSVSYKPAGEIEELRKVLGIGKSLDVIEAFDVSNIMGKEAVGSMVSFYKGKPRKSEYRKFRISTVPGIDDYAMMREIVGRRYARLLEEKRTLPDLILIDGGKGHLAAAVGELEKLSLADIPAIGIAKEFEHIYLKGKKDPLVLPKESKILHLLERIRDEAHRFAISYHKSLRSKKMGESLLDGIDGVGKKRKTALLQRFGSLDGVAKASLEELLKVEGMNERSARNIIDHFKR